MTLSGDQNGGLARMPAGVHGWVARGGPEVGRDPNSKAPSSMPVHKSKGVAKSWGWGWREGWGSLEEHILSPRRAQTTARHAI